MNLKINELNNINLALEKKLEFLIQGQLQQTLDCNIILPVCLGVAVTTCVFLFIIQSILAVDNTILQQEHEILDLFDKVFELLTTLKNSSIDYDITNIIPEVVENIRPDNLEQVQRGLDTIMRTNLFNLFYNF